MSYDTYALVLTLSAVASAVVSAIACAVWVRVARQRSSTPPLLAAALGLVVFGTGLVTLGAGGDSISPMALAMGLGGSGEALVSATLIAYASLLGAPRTAPLVVAGYLFATGTVASLAQPVFAATANVSSRTNGMLVGVVLLAAGVAGAVLARRLHALFDPSPLAPADVSA
jgi:hypothetical protein